MARMEDRWPLRAPYCQLQYQRIFYGTTCAEFARLSPLCVHVRICGLHFCFVAEEQIVRENFSLHIYANCYFDFILLAIYSECDAGDAWEGWFLGELLDRVASRLFRR